MKASTIFLLVVLTACKPYKISSIVKEIPISEFSDVDKGSNKITTINDLPLRIKNIPDFKYQEITTDSSLFNSKNGSTSLFVCGGYDRKKKSGFIIQRFIGLNEFNQCTLFKVQDGILIYNFYSLSTNINTWQDAKPYLIWPKDRMFNGGTAIFKPDFYKLKK